MSAPVTRKLTDVKPPERVIEEDPLKKTVKKMATQCLGTAFPTMRTVLKDTHEVCIVCSEDPFFVLVKDCCHGSHS